MLPRNVQAQARTGRAQGPRALIDDATTRLRVLGRYSPRTTSTPVTVINLLCARILFVCLHWCLGMCVYKFCHSQQARISERPLRCQHGDNLCMRSRHGYSEGCQNTEEGVSSRYVSKHVFITFPTIALAINLRELVVIWRVRAARLRGPLPGLT